MTFLSVIATPAFSFRVSLFPDISNLFMFFFFQSTDILFAKTVTNVLTVVWNGSYTWEVACKGLQDTIECHYLEPSRERGKSSRYQ